jgi:N-glycosylase/DNA lyase
LTLTSGQTFYWGNFENGSFNFGKPDGRGFWWGVSRGSVWAIKQDGNKIILQKGDYNLFFELFGIFDKLEELYELARKYSDTHLIRALESFKGLRLMRQDPWETLVSFILSAQK